MLPNSIRDQGGGYSNLDEFFFNVVPSFDRSHDVESTLLWIEKVDKLFDKEYIPMEDSVEFVPHKLKERTAAWWNRFQNMRMYQGKLPIRTCRLMKRLLQAHNLALKEEEMENRP